MGSLYFDHAATTPLAPEVLEAMLPFFADRFGNASSVHRRGEAARDAVDAARARVAALLGAAPEEIVFTASGSEANNLALEGVLDLAPVDRRRLVVSAIEHPSVLEVGRHLASRGYPLTIVPVEPSGLVDPDRLASLLGPDVALVSVQWVNNEVGTIQPIAELVRRTHACGARFHCDAVQAAARLAIDMAAVPVDLLSIAAHKMHGPLGAAALFVRRRLRLAPMIHGGHQERSRRAGTENLPAIVGLGAAAERVSRQLEAGVPEREAALGQRLLDGLVAAVGARLNGDRDARCGDIVNVCFSGIDGEAMLHELDREGVTVSTGSACSAADPGPSHVLMAMGSSPEDAHASVRFSLGEDHENSDVARVVAIATAVTRRLLELGGRARGPARPTMIDA